MCGKIITLANDNACAIDVRTTNFFGKIMLESWYMHLQRYMVSRGHKEPTHLLKRVGHVAAVPGVMVWPCLTGSVVLGRKITLI